MNSTGAAPFHVRNQITMHSSTFSNVSSRPAMFVFDILQIPRGCLQICSGCTAPNCTPFFTGLWWTIYAFPLQGEISSTLMILHVRHAFTLCGETSVQAVWRVTILAGDIFMSSFEALFTASGL
jgi:hypothetical protein